jgi:hypothetical protein
MLIMLQTHDLDTPGTEQAMLRGLSQYQVGYVVAGRDSRIDLETRDHQLENKFGASKCLNLGSITALGLCPLSRHFSDSAHDITRVGVIIMGHHA